MASTQPHKHLSPTESIPDILKEAPMSSTGRITYFNEQKSKINKQIQDIIEKGGNNEKTLRILYFLDDLFLLLYEDACDETLSNPRVKVLLDSAEETQHMQARSQYSLRPKHLWFALCALLSGANATEAGSCFDITSKPRGIDAGVLARTCNSSYGLTTIEDTGGGGGCNDDPTNIDRFSVFPHGKLTDEQVSYLDRELHKVCERPDAATDDDKAPPATADDDGDAERGHNTATSAGKSAMVGTGAVAYVLLTEYLRKRPRDRAQQLSLLVEAAIAALIASDPTDLLGGANWKTLFLAAHFATGSAHNALENLSNKKWCTALNELLGPLLTGAAAAGFPLFNSAQPAFSLIVALATNLNLNSYRRFHKDLYIQNSGPQASDSGWVKFSKIIFSPPVMASLLGYLIKTGDDDSIQKLCTASWLKDSTFLQFLPYLGLTAPIYDEDKERIMGWWKDKKPTIKTTFKNASINITQRPDEALEEGEEGEEGEEDEQKVLNTWVNLLFVDNSLASNDGSGKHPITHRFDRLFDGESICRRSDKVQGDDLTINPEEPEEKSKGFALIQYGILKSTTPKGLKDGKKPFLIEKGKSGHLHIGLNTEFEMSKPEEETYIRLLNNSRDLTTELLQAKRDSLLMAEDIYSKSKDVEATAKQIFKLTINSKFSDNPPHNPIPLREQLLKEYPGLEKSTTFRSEHPGTAGIANKVAGTAAALAAGTGALNTPAAGGGGGRSVAPGMALTAIPTIFHRAMEALLEAKDVVSSLCSLSS